MTAKEGTIFLDEIGETTPRLQAKLLRVLQEREFNPLGSDVAMRTNARSSRPPTAICGKRYRRDNFVKTSTTVWPYSPWRCHRYGRAGRTYLSW